ncbi:MAG: hypothetical protein EHM46_01580 [Bacteroidetes bacterium]|nr:MAG: hypothetical protein EHM46_01580 [Bacteroidota bacterium]
MRIISFGEDERMEQSLSGRIRRINLFYLVLSVMFLLSMIWAALAVKYFLVYLNLSFLLLSAALFFLVPAAKKPNTSAMLLLVMIAILLMLGYIFNEGLSQPVLLAFYLLFPLVAIGLNGQHGYKIAAVLAVATVVLNFVPLTDTSIQLGKWDLSVFLTTYVLLTIVSLFVERSNRILVTNLKDSRNQYESQVIQNEEFITRLSHKLRTSLSNITLINNLVHDSRLSSEQKELIETLKASTNSLSWMSIISWRSLHPVSLPTGRASFPST